MKHRKTTVFAATLLAAAAGFGAQSLIAQQPAPAFKRTVLQQQDLSIPERQAVTALAEIPAGIAVGRHTHPGEEIGYVLEGSLVLEIDGRPPVTVNAGQTFFVPAGMVHDGKNTGSSTAKVLANYVVEKGKPVASPAK